MGVLSIMYPTYPAAYPSFYPVAYRPMPMYMAPQPPFMPPPMVQPAPAPIQPARDTLAEIPKPTVKPAEPVSEAILPSEIKSEPEVFVTQNEATRKKWVTLVDNILKDNPQVMSKLKEFSPEMLERLRKAKRPEDILDVALDTATGKEMLGKMNQSRIRRFFLNRLIPQSYADMLKRHLDEKTKNA